MEIIVEAIFLASEMFLEIVTRLKNISQSDVASAIFVRTFNQLEIKSDNFSKNCKLLSELEFGKYEEEKILLVPKIGRMAEKHCSIHRCTLVRK